MNNLVIFLLDKKLWTSIFLTASPVHSAEFEELTCTDLFSLCTEILIKIQNRYF